MIQRIRNYVNEVFADAPHTKRANDLKEEVCSNLIDKFVDLTGHGMPEEEAYNAAIASIGDIDELMSLIKKDEMEMEDPQARKRSALLVAVAVSLYILSVIPAIICESTGLDEAFGGVGFFLFCAVATALIIYNAMTEPKYKKMDDTMVEEFKEWKHQKSNDRSLFGALSGALWTIVVAVYFIVSFMFGIWAYSWIIFLIGAAVQQIIRAIIIINR